MTGLSCYFAYLPIYFCLAPKIFFLKVASHQACEYTWTFKKYSHTHTHTHTHTQNSCVVLQVYIYTWTFKKYSLSHTHTHTHTHTIHVLYSRYTFTPEHLKNILTHTHTHTHKIHVLYSRYTFSGIWSFYCNLVTKQTERTRSFFLVSKLRSTF